MIDFHTHILPKMDDGSRGTEESLRMLREESSQGVSAVVLTPHYYAEKEKPERFLERRAASEQRLSDVIGESGEKDRLPQLFVGAEVKMFAGVSSLELLTELVIRGTRYILLEMPFEPWPESVFRELNAIKARGLFPIIAHVERYLSLQKRTDNIERLMDSDVLIQCNAEFFLQGFKSRKAFSFLKEDKVQLLGSDCHNLTSRPPNLGEALVLIRRKLGEDTVSRIEHRSRKVLFE